jgi:uracil-DNA glycosylase family 4
MNAPLKDCKLCPRLAEFRQESSQKHPSFYNGAVPAFGALDSKLLVVGLAPGLKGANQTGRPFTGDYAGDVLYEALQHAGLASGEYAKHAQDGLKLHQVRITNAVRCVPPQNKPQPDEVRQCGVFLRDEMALMPNLRGILCLGRVSHEAVLRILGLKLSQYLFGHGARHAIHHDGRDITIFDSFHTSRYNIQTKRLTREMFAVVMDEIKLFIG